MKRYTIQRRVEILKIFYKNSCSVHLHQIIFCDEAYIWLNGFVIKQNWHIRGESKPKRYQESHCIRRYLLFGVEFGQAMSLGQKWRYGMAALDFCFSGATLNRWVMATNQLQLENYIFQTNGEIHIKNWDFRIDSFK